MTAPLTISVGGVNITAHVPLDSVVVTESGCRQPGHLECDVVDVPKTLTVNPKAAVTVWDNTDGRYIFSGFLNPADINALGTGRSFHLSCDDTGEILDLSLVPSETRASETFYVRIVALVSTYGPLMAQTWTYIENPGTTLPAAVIENTNLRGAIEGCCSLAGVTYDYWLDGADLLHAGSTGLGAAPRSLTTGTPSPGTSINPEEPFTITRDPKAIVNAYYIRGANAAGSGWVTDGASIALYGRREAYYDAPNATTGAMRDAVGNAALADNSSSLAQGRVHVTGTDGWVPGQTLTILSAPQFDITSSATYRINLVDRHYSQGGLLRDYDIQFGGLIPTWQFSIPSPSPISGRRLATASIPIGTFSPTVRPLSIVGALPGLPNTDYPVGSAVVLTTDSKLYRNKADAWVKDVDGTDLVAATVSAAAIATEAIDFRTMGASALDITTAHVPNGTFVLGTLGALPMGLDSTDPAGHTDALPYWDVWTGSPYHASATLADAAGWPSERLVSLMYGATGTSTSNNASLSSDLFPIIPAGRVNVRYWSSYTVPGGVTLNWFLQFDFFTAARVWISSATGTTYSVTASSSPTGKSGPDVMAPANARFVQLTLSTWETVAHNAATEYDIGAFWVTLAPRSNLISLDDIWDGGGAGGTTGGLRLQDTSGTGTRGIQFGNVATTMLYRSADAQITAHGTILQNGILAPAGLTGNTNNWNPGSLLGVAILDMTSNGAYNLTGMVAGTTYQRIFLWNDSGFSITLKHNSASSSAGNKFYCPNASDVVIRTYGSVDLLYYAGFWIPLGI